ncbi:hypothetical protein L9F63_024782, partial [Diploptera punctata]
IFPAINTVIKIMIENKYSIKTTSLCIDASQISDLMFTLPFVISSFDFLQCFSCSRSDNNLVTPHLNLHTSTLAIMGPPVVLDATTMTVYR